MYINSNTSIDILILYNVRKKYLGLFKFNVQYCNAFSFAIVWGHDLFDVVTVTKFTLTPYYVYNHAI